MYHGRDTIFPPRLFLHARISEAVSSSTRWAGPAESCVGRVMEIHDGCWDSAPRFRLSMEIFFLVPSGLAVRYQHEIERGIYSNFNPSCGLDRTDHGECWENYVWLSADGLEVETGMRFSEPFFKSPGPSLFIPPPSPHPSKRGLRALRSRVFSIRLRGPSLRQRRSPPCRNQFSPTNSKHSGIQSRIEESDARYMSHCHTRTVQERDRGRATNLEQTKIYFPCPDWVVQP